MIKKIISGGQTGADEAGLFAGKECGLETGGWMTQGWRTQNGPKPEYEKIYNMKEAGKIGYASRTWKNIKDSDGTVRFANDFNSAGELCTLKGIETIGRPYFDIKVPEEINDPTTFHKFQEWIINNNIQILNVAGNAEKTYNGIFELVKNFLAKYLKEYNNI